MMTIKKTSTRTIHEMRCDAYIVALEADGKPFCSALPTKNKFRFFFEKITKISHIKYRDPWRNSIPNRKEVKPWNRFLSISSLP